MRLIPVVFLAKMRDLVTPRILKVSELSRALRIESH